MPTFSTAAYSPEEDDEDSGEEETSFGKKIKIDLTDMDLPRWKADLDRDHVVILELLSEMEKVTPRDDTKLLRLAPADGIQEIQVFEIVLNGPDLSHRILETIDRAIPYPVFYRLCRQNRVQHAAAYKSPAQDGSAKWVGGEYCRTQWHPADNPPPPHPPQSLPLPA